MLQSRSRALSEISIRANHFLPPFEITQRTRKTQNRPSEVFFADAQTEKGEKVLSGKSCIRADLVRYTAAVQGALKSVLLIPQQVAVCVPRSNNGRTDA